MNWIVKRLIEKGVMRREPIPRELMNRCKASCPKEQVAVGYQEQGECSVSYGIADGHKR
jgi:hypothetical protein